MWANAQRDGRPAEYRRRALCNAAKFGWRPLLECRAVMLPRRETRWNLQGCPKLAHRSQPLVGQSSPYCEDMCGRYCCLTSFFSDCRYVPQLRRYSPTKLCDGARMATFWRFFGSCISSEPRAAHFFRMWCTAGNASHQSWSPGNKGRKQTAALTLLGRGQRSRSSHHCWSQQWLVCQLVGTAVNADQKLDHRADQQGPLCPSHWRLVLTTHTREFVNLTVYS